GGDLIGQHFLETEAEQVRSVPAVRPGHDVAATAGGAFRAAVAGGARVGQPRANRQVRLDVPGAVETQRTLPLPAGELALEELPAPAYGSERIPAQDVTRAAGGHVVPPAGADFLEKGLGDARPVRVRSLRLINALSEGRARPSQAARHHRSRQPDPPPASLTHCWTSLKPHLHDAAFESLFITIGNGGQKATGSGGRLALLILSSGGLGAGHDGGFSTSVCPPVGRTDPHASGDRVREERSHERAGVGQHRRRQACPAVDPRVSSKSSQMWAVRISVWRCRNRIPLWLTPRVC